MNIGIVTTWMERGAAYVSKNYEVLLEQSGHNVFIYARGGENCAKGTSWDAPNVYWGEKNRSTVIKKRRFFSWIRKNNLDVIIFNEQKYFPILVETKKQFSNVRICAYVDYYKEDTRELFNIYDFVICNTHRHFEAMDLHPQRFYLKWGVDTSVYKPTCVNHDQICFFHSVGMSARKGTNILVDAFIDGKLFEKSKLVLHTQIPIEKVCNYTKDELEKYNIEVIQKTVTAPGLYYLGDVYVYPTTLDGLGLTMYEAIACGLPVITTDNGPMNEVINNDIGSLVKIDRFYSRTDGYYWPLCNANKDDLIVKMKYYIDNREKIGELRKKARDYAVSEYNLYNRVEELDRIMRTAKSRPYDERIAKAIQQREKNENRSLILSLFNKSNFLFYIKEFIYTLK